MADKIWENVRMEDHLPPRPLACVWYSLPRAEHVEAMRQQTWPPQNVQAASEGAPTARRHGCAWPSCGATFDTYSRLRRHRDSHAVRVECPLCPRGSTVSYNRVDKLQQHLVSRHQGFDVELVRPTIERMYKKPGTGRKWFSQFEAVPDKQANYSAADGNVLVDNGNLEVQGGDQDLEIMENDTVTLQHHPGSSRERNRRPMLDYAVMVESKFVKKDQGNHEAPM
ncbi:hypothetical protein EDC01DRAFT_635860 [Geopyxis carbonaria]|nr:hypothetical protein EDC01DRAFT_635860 [Geopyxis carbonaria]